MINVLLLSPDTAVRSSLARLLEAEPDVRVREVSQPGESPDVVLVNLNHADEAEAVRHRYPGSRILAHVSVLRPELRKADVDECLDSVAPYEVLLETIRRVARA